MTLRSRSCGLVTFCGQVQAIGSWLLNKLFHHLELSARQKILLVLILAICEQGARDRMSGQVHAICDCPANPCRRQQEVGELFLRVIRELWGSSNVEPSFFLCCLSNISWLGRSLWSPERWLWLDLLLLLNTWMRREENIESGVFSGRCFDDWHHWKKCLYPRIPLLVAINLRLRLGHLESISVDQT